MPCHFDQMILFELFLKPSGWLADQNDKQSQLQNQQCVWKTDDSFNNCSVVLLHLNCRPDNFINQ